MNSTRRQHARAAVRFAATLAALLDGECGPLHMNDPGDRGGKQLPIGLGKRRARSHDEGDLRVGHPVNVTGRAGRVAH